MKAKEEDRNKKIVEDVATKPERPRRVLIGTPSHDGKVDAQYANCLIETIKACSQLGVDVQHFFILYDALLVRARNDIFKQALQADVDDLVWIDSDMVWTPDQFIRLLSHPVDLVAGTARKKTDAEEKYAVHTSKAMSKLFVDDRGLMEVEGVGCAFTRMTRACMQRLWKKARPYRDDNRGGQNKMVFDVGVLDGEITGEDIMMSHLYRSVGGKVYLDTKITCGHIGVKMFVGNFDMWFKKIALVKQ
jgi:glycosyltransferase involved in cell wall biosynthesis